MPSTSTPMERRLLQTIQRIERDWFLRGERLRTEISALKAQLDAQNRTIAGLQTSLAELLDPPASRR